MGVRAQLAADLKKQPALKGYQVIDHPKSIDKISAKNKAVVMIVRNIVKPNTTQGKFIESIALWMIVPKTDDEGVAEDLLDDCLDDVIEALQPLENLKWDQATRIKYEDRYPAYRIDLTTATKQRETENNG